MKILVSSYAFSPSIGGIETISEMLAREFVRLGHEVRVVTQTDAEDAVERPFPVIRRPGARQLWQLFRWAEVIFQNNLSLRLLWPRLLMRRPCIVATQTWLSGSWGVETKVSWLKRFLLRRCRNVAISAAVAEHLGLPCTILGNPYDNQTFRQLPAIERKGELLFVGRLVSDKGLDLLLGALGRLRDAGLQPALTIVGDGPERARCEEQMRALGLDGQVTFRGVVRGVELAEAMNAHRVLVVPSRWAEPFGIVALEGIACGCVAVGSEEGGLKDAIGRCGLTVPNGDEPALAEALRRVLCEPAVLTEARRHAEEHLAKFQLTSVTQAYLALFQEALR